MKYLFITILILGSFFYGTILDAADSGRFDWSLGQPIVVDDPVNTCNNQATVRYDWSLGQPLPVFDATATCNTEAVTTVSKPEIWWE